MTENESKNTAARPNGAGRGLRSVGGEALAALAFFTRLPLPRAAAARPPVAGWGFPLAGAVVGAVGAAVLTVMQLWGPGGLPAALTAVAATILLTGALHEDGLADLADGLGANGDRARRLAIMRESRIGAYGALALILSVMLRAAALDALPLLPAAAALWAAHIWSRGLLVAVMRGPAATASGLAARLTPPSRRAVAGAMLTAAAGTAAAAVFIPWPAVLIACLIAAAAAGGVAMVAMRLLGGYTGDALGAAQQVGEIALLLCLAAAI